MAIININPHLAKLVSSTGILNNGAINKGWGRIISNEVRDMAELLFFFVFVFIE